MPQACSRGLSGLKDDYHAHEPLKASAHAEALPDRDDQPGLALGPDELDPSDTTSIPQGAALLTGRAVYSASRMGNSPGVLALYERERKRHEEEEARQLANLERWNREMTTVGGVRMTNAEAQEARRRVLEHADEYADRAIKNGDISEDDREEFKRWTRRKIELEDRRGRGTITSAEKREEAAGDASRVGRAVDGATAQNFKDHAQAQRPESAAPVENAGLRHDTSSALDDYALFKAAGEDTKRATSPSVAPSVAATGLNL